MREFQPSINLEIRELIWDEGFIREETEQTLAIRQAKQKDAAGYFMEMGRLRTAELKAWTEALKTDRELLELRERVARQALQIEKLMEELEGYRIKPGEIGAAEGRVLDLLDTVQKEFESVRGGSVPQGTG